jgi:hemolysin-activating ACP:hemolysin acyltransferase
MSPVLRHADPTAAELEIYGTLAFLAGFDPRLKHRTAREIEERFLWPAKLGLTNIFRDTRGHPVAAMVFAYLDTAHEKLLLTDVVLRGESALLSGNNLWVTHFMCPFTDAGKILRPFAKSGTGGISFRYPRLNSDGILDAYVECGPDAKGVFRTRTYRLAEQG